MRPPLLILGLAVGLHAATIVPGSLSAVLDTGSLAGLGFPVSFSYDSSQVSPVGQSFVSLAAINFTLLGVPFDRSNILQGGQVIFLNGTLENLTASFQGPPLPPHSPVENITFGFGGPGVIGYIDLNGQFGDGTFTFNAVPEPGTAVVMLLALLWLSMRATRSPARG
jgi:hypothetical protein